MFFLPSYFGLYIYEHYTYARAVYTSILLCVYNNIILQPLVFDVIATILYYKDVVYFSRLQNNFVFVVEPAEYI